jgi:hypothetical protein
VFSSSPLERVFGSSANPCDGCPPLPFIDAREVQKGKQDKSYNTRSLGCPLMCHCPPGRIEEERRFLVVEAAAWPDGAVHSRTLGAFSE